MTHNVIQKRIVVTGTGVVSPLGCGVTEVWRRLLAGQSGIRALAADIVEGTGVSVGGNVPTLAEDAVAGYQPSRSSTPRNARKWIDSSSLRW